MNSAFALRLLICISIIFNTSCIHLQSDEVQRFSPETENSKLADPLSTQNLQIKYVVYSEDKFPLSDFFNKLMQGEFNESFRQINLSYKPSNTSNEVIRTLLNRGLVPAYVSIKNTSTTEQKISFRQFNLTNGPEKFQPLPPSDLPRKIKSFSPKAVAANAYNVTVTITLVLVVALLLGSIHAQNLNWPSGGSGPSVDSDEKVLNETQFTTHIDYKDYLINEKILKPSEVTYGLIFFKPDHVRASRDFFMEYSE